MQVDANFKLATENQLTTDLVPARVGQILGTARYGPGTLVTFLALAMFPHRPHVATHIFYILEMFFFRINRITSSWCISDLADTTGPGVSATDPCRWRKQGSWNFRIPPVTTYRDQGDQWVSLQSPVSLFFRNGSCVVFLENAA